jgi:hypothetical protein
MIETTSRNDRTPGKWRRRMGGVVRSPRLLATLLTVALLGIGALPVATASAGYTGLGFDACSAPPATTMTAWLASPYRAIGVYVGGANRACTQPNLTADWISAETLAGWKFIPTYVGLQAPGSSCGGCKTIDPKQAVVQGTADATDAANQMRALGLGPGNPVYFDMEHYQRGGQNTLTALAFLGAWTTQLHADGYTSGIYSSASSGISDLVAAAGTSYVEPDALWIADWNGLQTVSDSYVPDALWPAHQRLHQYWGGHKETYGGASLKIDNNYLDGPVAPGAVVLSNRKLPAIKVRSKAHHKLIVDSGAWSGSPPITFAYQWMRCTKTAGQCRMLRGATHLVYRPGLRDVGHRLKVVVTATNAAGTASASAVTHSIKKSLLP